MPTPSPEREVAQIERVIRDWLEEPAITLICGDWRRGSIMELCPASRAVLSEARYDEPFTGLRDLRLVGEGHHLHLDLAKLSTAVYTVTPSVCYGYRPSFEVRFTADPDGAGATGHRSHPPARDPQTPGPAGFALAVREPYAGGRTNRAALVGYFRRMLEHQALFPQVTRFQVDTRGDLRRGPEEAWRDAHACLVEAREQVSPGASPVDHAAPFARAAADLLAQGADG